MTKYALEHMPLYQQTKARGFFSGMKEQGMVMTDLEHDQLGPCKRAYKLSGLEPETLCTHGPDPAPPGFNMYGEPAPPSREQSTVNQREYGSKVTCDGDGETGNRVELIYAHAANQPSRLDIFRTTFQQYASDIDSMVDISATETGDTRHVRYVHDTSCVPKIAEVSFPPTAISSFSQTVAELNALGFNKISRKYIVFVDAHIYCGIGTLNDDDTVNSSNLNNSGPSYGRVDAGCWSASVPAHELGHMLGAVQLSSPHSGGAWHCVDEYDRMCYLDGPRYPAMQYACDNPSHDVVFDCNHDDYFNTDPVEGSYLSTHWNMANSQFLIGAPKRLVQEVRSLFPQKEKGNRE